MPGFTTGIFICYIREEIHNKNEGNIMPIIKSAKKRVRVAKKASARNSKTKTAGASVKTHKPAVKKAAPTKAAKRPVKKATVKKSPAKKKAK
jgi:ribosomal protein S20